VPRVRHHGGLLHCQEGRGPGSHPQSVPPSTEQIHKRFVKTFEWKLKQCTKGEW
jgi:hypothetical protein